MAQRERRLFPALREMLKDEGWRVQRAAAQALAQVAGRKDIPALREMLKDEDSYVRLAAAQALEELATEENLTWLVEDMVKQLWAG